MSISDVQRVCALWNKIDKETDAARGVTMFDMWRVVHDIPALKSLVEMARAALPLLPGTLFFGMATRGVPLATLLASECEGPLISVVKTVKLPAERVLTIPYTSEYETGALALPRRQLPAQDGDVLFPAYIVDDVVATGGQARALVEAMQREYPHVRVLGVISLIEFEKCDAGVPVHSAFRCMPGGQYLGVGSLFHSWLPVVDCGVRSYAMSMYVDPMMRDDRYVSIARVNFYSPTLQHLRKAGEIWRPIPTERFPGGVLNGQFEYADLPDAQVAVYIDMTDMRNRDVAISFCRILPSKGIDRLDIHVPFYPDGTMERVDREGTIASAETVARMFCDIPHCTHGPAILHLYDLHAVTERFFFKKSSVTVKMHSVFDPTDPLFWHDWRPKMPDSTETVVFPDDGAHKRYGHLFEHNPTIAFVKLRDGGNRAVQVHFTKNTPLSSGELARRSTRIRLYDDLTRTGGTILETLKALAAAGAPEKSVDVYIANVDFVEDAAARFFGHLPPCFRKLFVGGGTRKAYDLSRHPLFGDRVELISIAICKPVQATLSVVGSLNPEKRCRTRFAACVPSGVPNQPNVTLAVFGARNRAEAAYEITMKLFEVERVVGPESGIDGSWRDMSVVAGKRIQRIVDTVVTDFEVSAHTHKDVIVPERFRREDIVGDVTFGSLMRAAWSLPTDDAWIRVLGGDRRAVFDRISGADK